MNLQLISRPAPPGVPRETAGVLGGAWLGVVQEIAPPEWPVQRILAPVFGSTAESLEETWLADSDLSSGFSEGIVWCRAGGLLYGVLELDEATFAPVAGATSLQLATTEAYRRIFRLLAAQNLPNLWRVWNYLAEINQESSGLERYRQFNVGRQDAFLEFQHCVTGNAPAACALGLAGGPLSIAFMAGEQPAVPVENPRQVSAYNYPAEYGPRSPTFSRGALVYLPGQEILFISGTASIVGYQTVHSGDVLAQCDESLTNVASVVAEANRLNRSIPFALGDFSYRAYVRHAGDFAGIQTLLADRLGTDAEIVYVQADICRNDLLIEIEAMASHSLETS